jgi:hypothetical protein
MLCKLTVRILEQVHEGATWPGDAWFGFCHVHLRQLLGFHEISEAVSFTNVISPCEGCLKGYFSTRGA